MHRNFNATLPIPVSPPWRKLILGELILVLLIIMVAGCVSVNPDDATPTRSPTEAIATQIATYVPTRAPTPIPPVPTAISRDPTSPTATSRPTRPTSTRPPARTPTPTFEQRAKEDREIRLKQQELETKAEVTATLIVGFLADGIIDKEEKPIFCASVPGFKADLTEARNYAKEYRKIDSKMVTIPIDLQEYEEGLQEYLDLLAEVARTEC